MSGDIKSNFDGKWLTRDGTLVEVQGTNLTILDCDTEYITGWKFPINEKGNCPITPNLDLIEKFRPGMDGYTEVGRKV